MATVRMPSSLHAQMTRSAISPRFAIRIFLNISAQMWGQPPSAVRRAQPGPSTASLQTQKGARGARALVLITSSLLRPDGEQLLPIFNGLAVAAHLLYDFAGHIRLDLIQQFHRLNDAQYLPHFHHIPDLDERRRARRRSLI